MISFKSFIKESTSEKEWDSHAQQAFGSLSNTQKNSVQFYQNNGHATMNSMLRGESNPTDSKRKDLFRHHINSLDSAIKQSTVPQSTTVHRGIGISPRKMFGKQPEVGDIFHHPSFYSASRSTAPAYDAANLDPKDYAYNKTSYGTLLSMKIKQGETGLVTPRRSIGNEKEIILPKGMNLRITKIKHLGPNSAHIHVERT